jgi:hypothetical protein
MVIQILNEEGVWQNMIKKKYLQNKTLSQVGKRKGDSQFWKGLMDVKDNFLERGRFVVHSGQQTDFWRDLWIGNKPLMKAFPSLYNLT